MANITVGDVTGTAEIQADDSSLLGKSELGSLTSATAQFVQSLSKPIDAVNFQSATLKAAFQAPSISIDDKRSLTVNAGANAAITRYSAEDSPLLGSDPSVPSIVINAGEYWLSFEVDGTLDISGTQNLGSAFGVSVEGATAAKLYTYVQFANATGPLPTLGTAIGATLNSFRFLVAASDIRAQKPGRVCVSDLSGTVTVSGSYSVPIGVSQIALAEALVPFKIDVTPKATVTVGGSVALTGDFAVRSWRKSDNELILGLFKKRETTFTVKFSAGAGLGATAGNTDLIAAFFNAIAPGVDLTAAGLIKDDPRYDDINGVLQDSLSNALEISINASCAASFGDEAALLYSINLSGDRAATDAAINAAIGGDWSLLAHLGNATEQRNVVGTDRETSFKFTVNLLGIFNYESVSEFVRSSTILHNLEDGSITITDKATAARISAASTPYRADADKLRSVLYEGTIATAVYAVASGKTAAGLSINQSLFTYQAQTTSAALRKELRLAVAIGELAPAQLNAIRISPKPRQVAINASQAFTGQDALALFFADTVARTPHHLQALTDLGRRTLGELLDPSDSVDARRIQILNSDALWAEMDEQHFPTDSPASYSDWYDVTFWANSIHDIAAPLKAVLEALEQLPQGADPSKNANFKKKRSSLQSAVSEVIKDTHAAFEKGWPIAVMDTLAGGRGGATMTAKWDGVTQIPIAQQLPMRPNALSKHLAARNAGTPMPEEPMRAVVEVARIPLVIAEAAAQERFAEAKSAL